MERYKVLVGGEEDSAVDKYTSSLEFDREIAKYVAMVVLAHVEELTRKGILAHSAYSAMREELVKIVKDGGKGLYEWIASKGRFFEDVFEALEAYLYDKVGLEAGRIALGRSRNDHVAAALRLALRDNVVEVLSTLLELRRALLDKGIRYRDTVFPFFTHAQVAQCGSAMHYFLSYERAFGDLWDLLHGTFALLNQNPLGSGAAVGSFLELDLKRLSGRLCLDSVPIPPYYATGSRLFLLYVVAVIALVMVEVGRFVEDVILLLNAVPRGMLIPENHISTSSIMPHKRNPVTLEIARAKVSGVLGIFTALLSTYKSVPYGYNLDFQEMSKQAFNAVKDALETLKVLVDFVKRLELDGGAIQEYIADKPCWSSDLVEYLAISENKPVRELYVELAGVLKSSSEKGEVVLGEFFRKHGTESARIFELLKQKPAERELDALLDYSEKRVINDYEKLKELLSTLQCCNKTLLGSS